MSECDVAVVGGGIVGLAVARELLRREPERSLVVLEAADRVGTGQTGANSGVVHAGVYYAPGSLKARLCVEGARELYDYCDERGIRAQRIGKVIVATDARELTGLDELERRGQANGVPGLRRIGPEELRELEPHARGIAALHSPNTGIADFAEVARSFAADVEAAGAAIVLGARVEEIKHDGSGAGAGPSAPGAGPSTPGGVSPSWTSVTGLDGVRLVHSRGELRARRAIFCAGRAADRVAVLDGADPDPRIVPFRGAYLRLKRPELVRSLIYPVPDVRLPFLGVHLTRHTDGSVLIGPSAFLEPHLRSLTWPGTWKVMRRFWRTGITEIGHALSTGRMVSAARRYVPELEAGDVERAWSSARAQAVGRDGTLYDDFAFSETQATLHVRNAPSPAATASLAIARFIADRFEKDRG
jgi:2-hydroxyglutarate dehydrogenase